MKSEMRGWNGVRGGEERMVEIREGIGEMDVYSM